MNELISIFLPVRKGSERVKNKNTRQFSDHKGGLLDLKISQLVNVENIGEIIVSTNDNECVKIAEKYKKIYPRIIIDIRPEKLATSNTSLTDLVNYVPEITNYEHILWTHVTSPFFDEQHYNKSIKQYIDALNDKFDSLMSVLPFQNFLWNKEKNDLINRKGNEKWPRTQDLMNLYEIDSAVFIASSEIYKTKSDRIGDKPFLYENNKIASFDIDWEDDFLIAEAIYKQLRNNIKIKY